MVLCTWAYAPWPSHKTCEEYWCSSFICNTRCLIWSWLCASNGPLSSHEEARKWSAAKGDLPTFNIHRCLIRWMSCMCCFIYLISSSFPLPASYSWLHFAFFFSCDALCRTLFGSSCTLQAAYHSWREYLCYLCQFQSN